MPINHCYKVILKDDKEFKYSGAACYVSHYQKLDTVKAMELYIGHEQAQNITREEMISYSRLLRRMGLKFRLKKNHEYKPENRDKIYPTYRFEFNTEENNIIACMILLNATRYTWECNGYHVVKSFLKFAQEKSDLCLFDRFILAHYFGAHFLGHLMISCSQLSKIIGQKEYKKWLSRTDNPFRVDDLFGLHKADSYAFNKSFKPEDTLEERYKKYLELCDK